jgi:hypothetical protein
MNANQKAAMSLLLNAFHDSADMAALAGKIDEARALLKQPSPRRGRPPGARTRADTPAIKRAREFMRIYMVENLDRKQAARRIAQQHGLYPHQIENEFERHRERLAVEIENDDAALERLFDILEARLDDLLEKMIEAIQGTTDENECFVSMREASTDWRLRLADELRQSCQFPADLVVRGEFVKALLADLTED